MGHVERHSNGLMDTTFRSTLEDGEDAGIVYFTSAWAFPSRPYTTCYTTSGPRPMRLDNVCAVPPGVRPGPFPGHHCIGDPVPIRPCSTVRTGGSWGVVSTWGGEIRRRYGIPPEHVSFAPVREASREGQSHPIRVKGGRTNQKRAWEDTTRPRPLRQKAREKRRRTGESSRDVDRWPVVLRNSSGQGGGDPWVLLTLAL